MLEISLISGVKVATSQSSNEEKTGCLGLKVVSSRFLK